AARPRAAGRGAEALVAAPRRTAGGVVHRDGCRRPMISEPLLSLVRCPDCHGVLAGTPDSLICRGCGRPYHSTSPDYLDLRPRVAYSEQTKYLDETLHADARHETVSPPLLGSRIRNDMLRAFLAPEP